MRWFLGCCVLVAIAVGAVLLCYQYVIQPRRELENRIHQLEQDKQRLESYVTILEHNDRRARVEVLRQIIKQTTIRFTETDANGKPISASRDFTLPDDEVYFDTLVIKFDDHFVEQNDPLKGHALMLFRRIFSSTMRPEDGFQIDTPGEVPKFYLDDHQPSPFEIDLWKRFWELANDEKLAREKGVRAIHGDAPYMRMEPNRVYEILLRSTGELSITPGAQLALANTIN